MITTTHSHKHWTDEGGHVTAAVAGPSLALMGIGKASSVLARLRGQPGIQA